MARASKSTGFLSTGSGNLTIREWYEAALRYNYYSQLLLTYPADRIFGVREKNGAAAGFGRGAEFLFTREI